MMKTLLTLTVVGLLASVAGAGLMNPGFEDGLDSWESNASYNLALNTADYTEGSQSLEFTGTTVAAQAVEAPAGRPSGSLVELTFDLKMPGSKPSLFRIRLYGDADGALPSNKKGDGGTLADFTDDISGQGWQTITISTTDDWAYYVPRFESGAGILVDNVSLAMVPEPATLSLLALGGLALIRRRR
jgi:hypothetical protein